MKLVSARMEPRLARSKQVSVASVVFVMRIQVELLDTRSGDVACWRSVRLSRCLGAVPGGVLVVFTDAAAVEVRLQGLRAEAHAARCYALACDKIVDLAEFGHLLDARPVRVGGGHLEIKGSDALVSLRFYFENAFSAVDLAKGKPCCEENDR